MRNTELLNGLNIYLPNPPDPPDPPNLHNLPNLNNLLLKLIKMSSSELPLSSSYLGNSSQGSDLQDVVQLTRGGLNRSSYLWREQDNAVFQAWWEKTSWYYKNSGKPNGGYKVIWGSQKQAAIWKYFQEGAQRDSGEPVIICIQCDKTLKHPSAGQGNKSAEKHLSSDSCKKTVQVRGKAQTNIEDGFRAQVRVSTIISTIISNTQSNY